MKGCTNLKHLQKPQSYDYKAKQFKKLFTYVGGYQILGLVVISCSFILLLFYFNIAAQDNSQYLSIQYSKLNNISCKIGILNIEDYVDKKSSLLGKKYRECLKDQIMPPKVINQSDYIAIDFSHIIKGLNMGPHVAQVILQNTFYQQKKEQLVDVDDADLVLVNDFCFMFQYAPFYQVQEETRDNIWQVYQNIQNSSRWKQKNCNDFVLVRAYPSENGLFNLDFLCNFLQNSILVSYEWQHYFGRCKNILKPYGKRTILMPYVPLLLPTKINPPEKRNILVSFIGSCAPPDTEESQGNKMRRYLFESIMGDDISRVNQSDKNNEVMFRCSCQKLKGARNCDPALELSHQDVTRTYKNSKFCFVLAGDTISSRRIMESVLEGCVPIFVGQPFHALPFRKRIDYTRFAIFFKIYKTASKYLTFFQQDVKEKQYLEDEFVPWKSVVQVKSGKDIVSYLRKMPCDDYLKYFEYVQQCRSMFEFVPNPSGYPSGVDVIFEELCQMYNTQVERF